MKNIINIQLIVTLFLFLFAASYMNAQPKDKKPPMIPNDEQIAHMVEDMAKQLDLTEAQKEKVLLLHKEHFQKLRGMMKKENEGRDKMREEHEQFKKQLEQDVKSIIGENQVQKYEEFLKNMEARHNGVRGNHKRQERKRQ